MSDRAVWRPTRPEPSGMKDVATDPSLRCGGADDRAMSVDERFEHFRALRREQAEAEEKARTAEKDERDRKADDDEDEQRVIERFRNDRYAVKLLRQSDDVWGGGAGDAGALG